MLESIAVTGFVLWALTMWRLGSVQEDVRLIREQLRKGGPLTEDEEERAASGRSIQRPPVMKA